MSVVAQYVMNGVMLGMMYALVAVGFTLFFGVLDVIQFSHGDVVAAGERCASTTNRNFRGRQGPLARTHLMSPAMVAAAAVTGRLADVRPLLAGRRLQAQ